MLFALKRAATSLPSILLSIASKGVSTLSTGPKQKSGIIFFPTSADSSIAATTKIEKYVTSYA